MRANFGVYQNEIVKLSGDILYTREDGFRFATQSASYNRKTSLAKTQDPYVAYMGLNRVQGEGLTYNNVKQKAFSKKLTHYTIYKRANNDQKTILFFIFAWSVARSGAQNQSSNL